MKNLGQTQIGEHSTRYPASSQDFQGHDNQKSYHRSEETRMTWQLSAFGSWIRKTTLMKNDEIQIKSEV